MQEIETAKKARLNPKKLAFARAYTQLGAETFHNGAKSARFAGYSHESAGDIACKLLKQDPVADQIRQLEAEAWDWTFEKWTQEVSKSAYEVDAKHANRPRYLELLGKSKGWLTERTNVSNNLYVLGSQDLQAIRSQIATNLLQDRRSNKVIGHCQETEKGPTPQSIDSKQVIDIDCSQDKLT